MPTNQFQRMVFAFLTVLVTVHAYVFYSLYVVNGATLMEITGADSVIHAIFTQLFFIQPLIRTIFKLLFRKNIPSTAH